MLCCGNEAVYNDYSQMRNACYKVITYLLENNEDIWKLLKYPTPDALNNENLTRREKSSLIYTGTGDMKDYRVFRQTFMDDIFDEQCSQLRVYITSVNPDTLSYGTVDIAVECVVHTKLINLINYENRLEVLLQQVIKTLNGADIGGIGRLFFDRNGSMYDLAKLNLYSNRNFYGYTVILSTRMGGVNGCDKR